MRLVLSDLSFAGIEINSLPPDGNQQRRLPGVCTAQGVCLSLPGTQRQGEKGRLGKLHGKNRDSFRRAMMGHRWCRDRGIFRDWLQERSQLFLVGRSWTRGQRFGDRSESWLLWADRSGVCDFLSPGGLEFAGQISVVCVIWPLSVSIVRLLVGSIVKVRLKSI